MGRHPADEKTSGRTLRQSEEELALVRRLADVTRHLVGEIDAREVVAAVAQAGVDLLGADAAVIALTEDGASAVNAVSIGVDPALHALPIVPREGLHGQVLATGAPIVIDDYNSWEHAVPDFVDIGFYAAVAVPIATKERTVGVLSVHHRDAKARVSEHELTVLTLLAEHAASAILRARSYQQVAEQEARFAALISTMPDGLAVVEHGVVTAWNRGAERLTSRPAADVIGNPPPFDFAEAIDRTDIDTVDGKRWVEAVSNPLPGGGGVVWLLRDVTEQERLEQARNLFLATTSHELKTPLTVVKGLAITLRRNWDRMTEAQRAEALETIERRTIHLDRLVERVLVGSRVEAGVMDFHITPVEVAQSINDVIEGFAAVAPMHQLKRSTPASMPLVAADRQALDTVLGHLVDNAIKYSPSGGEVNVSVAAVDKTAQIAVDDRGRGITGELVDLLQPFNRGDRHTTRRIAGIGIGLYVVSRLVEGMHGSLTAVNRPGGGTSFCVTLPLWRDS